MFHTIDSSLVIRQWCPKMHYNDNIVIILIVFITNEFGTSLSLTSTANFLVHCRIVQNLMIIQINRDDFPISFHFPLRERDGYKQSINSWNGRRKICSSRLKQGQRQELRTLMTYSVISKPN